MERPKLVCEIKCQHCGEWSATSIEFGESHRESFEGSGVGFASSFTFFEIASTVKCPRCGQDAGNHQENMRLRPSDATPDHA